MSLSKNSKNLSIGFWQKVDTYEEQPDVHFKHELVVILETDDPGKVIGWSTLNSFNQLLHDQVRVPLIKVRSI